MNQTMARTPKAPYTPRIEIGQLATRVQSERDPAIFYDVTEHGSSCTCPGFQYRGSCKHLQLARAAEDASDAKWRGTPGVCVGCGTDVPWRDVTGHCALCLERSAA